jgi:Leucine-rich repeat (LRR) protein
LERLDLTDTHVTDAGLAHLASLPKLQQLRLDGTPITDDGLVHLGKLKSLRELSLSGIKISSDGAKHLQDLQSLESLDLSRTFVDGEFDWPASLQHVDLYNSCMTDKGLLQLAKCPKLLTVSLSRTLVTREGEAQFWKSRPDVQSN